MKILTVDDDPFFLEVLEAMLDSGGFKDVTSAVSAQQAAQIISGAAQPFDCAFIDMRMPEIEGDYLCRWLRRLPDYHDASIVMLTASGKKEDVQRAFMSGASDYITKPVDATELLSRTRQIALTGGGSTARSGAMADTSGVAEQREQTYFDAVQIEGVKRSVKLDALANYVAQLSRSSENKLSVVTFHMREGAELHRRCTSEEFTRVLAAAARAILAHAQLPHPFIAYCGSGVFLIVSDTAAMSPDQREAIEAAINDELRAKGLTDGAGRAIKVTVAMMETHRLGGRTEQQNVTAMYRAIENAEHETLSIRLGLLST